MYAIMAGIENTVPLAAHPAETLRLGVPRPYFLDRLEPVVGEAFEDAVACLRSSGIRCTDVRLARADTIARNYVNVVLPEAAWFHAPILDARPDAYTPRVRERLQLARNFTPSDYTEGLVAREQLRTALGDAMTDVDALVLPTLPIVAPPLGAATVPLGGEDEPVRNAMLRLTQLFNLTGTPAVSIPARSRTGRLPVGIQLAGKPGGTRVLLEIALRCERLFGG
jgi:aspartyl-tRNA(Asn)/glutamyl-tRNA(Gln) amidotransferase subunit A